MSNTGEKRIFVEKDFMNNSVKIWYEQRGFRMNEYYNYSDNGVVITQRENNCMMPEGIKPFMTLPINFYEDFMQSILNLAYDEKREHNSASFTDGKLKATEKQVENLMTVITKLIEQ